MAPESRMERLNFPLSIGESRSIEPFPAISTTTTPFAVAFLMASKLASQYYIATHSKVLAWQGAVTPLEGPGAWNSMTMISPTRNAVAALLIPFAMSSVHQQIRRMQVRPKPEETPIRL